MSLNKQVYNTAFLFQELIVPASFTTAVKEIGILVFVIIILLPLSQSFRNSTPSLLFIKLLYMSQLKTIKKKRLEQKIILLL